MSEMLHPRRSAQEVLLCELCETFPLECQCERCNVNLCTNCSGKHLSDSSKDHNVVRFVQRKYYSKCRTHTEKLCEFHCEKCDIPICSTCALFGEHKGHEISELSAKTESLHKDLEELETRIYPRYQEMVSDIQTEMAELEIIYESLTTAADQQGEALHQEITTIVNERKSYIEEMKNQHLCALNTDEITQKITKLEQIISNLKSILKSNDFSLSSTYRSRNSEFKTLPPKVCVSLPRFSLQKINKEQLREMFGSLSPLSIHKENDETINSAEAVSSPVTPMTSPEAVPSPPVTPMTSPAAVLSPPVKPLLDEQHLTSTINTGYIGLFGVSCISENEIWTHGNDNIMKLLNLKSELLTSIKTKSGNNPGDIATTRDGDLVYTDSNTVNLVKNKQIQTVIKLQDWMPLNVCNTASDDLLVTMVSDDENQSKVVRYSGSTGTQNIQFDDQGRPLYTTNYSCKYVSENRNLDICVADRGAKAVVVVNQSGKLRFKYTGHPTVTKKTFYPLGIITDSQSHILTSDRNNGCIHILDQDGQFLRHIQNCGLRAPHGLCVDIRDNLFVAECTTDTVRKIQYLNA